MGEVEQGEAERDRPGALRGPQAVALLVLPAEGEAERDLPRARREPQGEALSVPAEGMVPRDRSWARWEPQARVPSVPPDPGPETTAITPPGTQGAGYGYDGAPMPARP